MNRINVWCHSYHQKETTMAYLKTAEGSGRMSTVNCVFAEYESGIVSLLLYCLHGSESF